MSQASLPTIFGQLGLNRFEQSRVDDRRVLAGIALVEMVDLADVHSIAQHMGQWPIGEGSAADFAAGGKCSPSVIIPRSRKSCCSADSDPRSR